MLLFLNSKYITQIISFQESEIVGRLRKLHVDTAPGAVNEFVHELIFRAVPDYFRRQYMRICRTSSRCARKARQDHFLTSHEGGIQRLSP